MTKEIALRIFGLNEPIDKEIIGTTYKKIAREYYRDKNPNDKSFYDLNEAKQILLHSLREDYTMSLSVIVADALIKYKEAEKKEAEYKNEASLLISQKTKPKRYHISTLRNVTIGMTCVFAIVGFLSTFTTGVLDVLYDDDTHAIEYAKEVPTSYPTLKTTRFDSLYLNDSNYRKKVDNYYTSVIKRDEKKRNGRLKLAFIVIVASGGVVSALIQMRLNNYDSTLSEFKLHVDSVVKLKRLLNNIIEVNNIQGKVTEQDLKRFIGKYFSDESSDSLQSISIMSLAKKLELQDVESIISLKFLEKKLIDEYELHDRMVTYNILI